MVWDLMRWGGGMRGGTMEWDEVGLVETDWDGMERETMGGEGMR